MAQSNKKQVALNIISQVAAFVINLAINFWLAPFIISNVGKDVYGFVGLANNFTSYITIFTVAINGMLSRYITIALSKKEIEKARVYFTSVTLLNIGCSIVLSALSALFILNLDFFLDVPAAHSSDIKLLWAFIFLSFFIALCFSSYTVSTFSANKLSLSAVRNLIGYIIRAVFMVMLFYIFTPHVWYVGASAVLVTVYKCYYDIYYKKVLTPELIIRKKYFDWKAIRELISIGLWNSLNQLQNVLNNGLMLLLTNLFIGATEMSLFSYAKMVPLQLLSLIGMVANSFAPSMTITYANGDKKQFAAETGSAMKICGALCSVPILGLIVFGQDFFGLWLGELSNDDIFKVHILSILSIAPNIVSVYIYPLYTVNTITKKLKTPVLVSLGVAAVNLAASYILLKTTNLGVYSIAIPFAVLWIIRIITFVPIYAAHSLKLKITTFYPYLLRGMAASAVVVAGMFAINYFVSINSWIDFIITALLAGAYGYIVNFILILSKNERSKLLNRFIKKKGR